MKAMSTNPLISMYNKKHKKSFYDEILHYLKWSSKTLQLDIDRINTPSSNKQNVGLHSSS